MPEYYKLIYSSSQEIPLYFYDYFDIISKLEFPLYQELLFKRPCSCTKSFLTFKLLSLNLPLPLFFTDIKDISRRNIKSPLHYSKLELEKLKMYNLINK